MPKSDSQMIDSPLCPRNASQWLMPAMSAAHLSAAGAEPMWYPGNRRLKVRTYRELCAVFDDGYIHGICQRLVGDYIHVFIDGEIKFPVEIMEEPGSIADMTWTLESGLKLSRNYRHHLVIHGGTLSIDFFHSMYARPVVFHGGLHERVDIQFFSGLSGVVFMGTHFRISGRITFDDSSEVNGGYGNNSPNIYISGGARAFKWCSGLSLVDCRADIHVEVDNV